MATIVSCGTPCVKQISKPTPWAAAWTRWHGKRGFPYPLGLDSAGLAALGLAEVSAQANQGQRGAVAVVMTACQHTAVLTETLGDIVVSADHWGPAGSSV
jgi:hypothetical protein